MDEILNDLALQPVKPDVNPGAKYAAAARVFQGIPTLERSADGKLWAAWYSGGTGEGPDNYVLLASSPDDGSTWSKPLLVIDPPEKVRAFDPCLWTDPAGRLWLFWAQSWTKFDGRCGVWAIRCDEPEAPVPRWTEPRRLANGIMMNKPTVLSTGEWLMPSAIWNNREPRWPQFERERKSNLYVSTNSGETWTLLGGPDVPERSCDEHMVVELRDGSLMMLVRTTYGIAKSLSRDRGRTWEKAENSGIPGPNSRFFIRRLKSGRLLLVNHYGYKLDPNRRISGRTHLAALLSEDDGRTWAKSLMLDEREDVSYPDGVEAPDGKIYIVYDRERKDAREILMSVFTEEDVLAGRVQSKHGRLRVIVDRAGQA